MAKRLSMVFKTETGSKATISISTPKEDVTAEDVSLVMDNIISSDAIYTKGGALTEKVSAKLTDTNVEDIEIL